MPNQPEIPLDQDAQHYGRRVEEQIDEYKKAGIILSDAKLRKLAEDMVAPYFFFGHKKQERPN